MKVTRRDFLKWAGIASVGAVACNVFPDREMTIQSPVDLPEDLVTGTDNWYATLCQQCPEREGIVIRVMEGRAKKVQGNPAYPTNQGKQSVRCEGGLQALYHPDRIATPMLRTPTGFQPIGWNQAIDTLRDRLRGLPDHSSMLMATEPLRGQVGLLVKGFVEAYGGRHLAFEPLDQGVLRAAVKEVYGQDTLPDFDIENTRYLLSFGADFLSTWLSPVRFARGYGQFRGDREGKGRGTFVHVDPRYSMTAANADQWLPVSPGREGILALSIAYVIVDRGLGVGSAVDEMSGGAGSGALLSAMNDFRPENVVNPDHPLYVGLPAMMRGKSATQLIEEIARDFATQHPSLAIGGGESGAHTNGVTNLSAIYALNFLVGSVGRRPGEGGVVFNPPPAFDDVAVGSGTGTLVDWMSVAEDLRRGRINVLMVRGANPIHGLPERAGLREALRDGQPFIVSFSSFMDDTTQLADLVLPERIYPEDWADDVPDPGPGYQMVGMQQPVVNPLPELDPRSFPDLLLAMAHDLGLDGDLPEVFQDVNSFADALRRRSDELFELRRGSPQGGSSEAPTAREFWNKLLQQGGWWDVQAVSTDPPPRAPNLGELAQRLAQRLPSFSDPGDGKTFYLVPFLSNSLLDGRGAHLPWLQAAPDPLTTVTWQTWIEINSREAEEMGLKEGDVVRVISAENTIEAIVYPHPATPPGVVSVPVGQGHDPGVRYMTRQGERRGSNPISILTPQSDIETGSLAWAATRVLVHATGRNVRVSKFEGLVPAFPIGTKEEDIVQVTRG